MCIRDRGEKKEERIAAKTDEAPAGAAESADGAQETISVADGSVIELPMQGEVSGQEDAPAEMCIRDSVGAVRVAVPPEVSLLDPLTALHQRAVGAHIEAVRGGGVGQHGAGGVTVVQLVVPVDPASHHPAAGIKEDVYKRQEKRSSVFVMGPWVKSLFLVYVRMVQKSLAFHVTDFLAYTVETGKNQSLRREQEKGGGRHVYTGQKPHGIRSETMCRSLGGPEAGTGAVPRTLSGGRRGKDHCHVPAVSYTHLWPAGRPWGRCIFRRWPWDFLRWLSFF